MSKFLLSIGRRIELFFKPLAAYVVGTYIRPRKAKGPIPLDKVDRLLLLRNDALGDAVVTTPIWRILKRLKPSIHIGVVGSTKNIELLKVDPDIDEVFELDLDKPSRVIEQQVSQTPWDVVMCFVYKQKTQSALQAKRVAPNAYSSTVAFTDFLRYDKFFSIVSKQKREGHMTEIIRKHLIDTVDTGTSLSGWHPSLMIPDSLSTSVRSSIFEQLGPSIRRYIHVNLHASIGNREWGFENSLAFAERVRDAFPDTGIVFTGAPDRIHEVRSQSTALPGGVILYETVSQPEAIAVVRHSSLVITPDTSITHIASAEKKPVVTFHYCFNEWYPYNVPHSILRKPEDGLVKDIPVDEVLKAALSLLQ